MRPSDFKRWRRSLELSQKQAAEALGLKRRMVQYYEKGERDGDKVAVPKAVRLACWALAAGVGDYHGPDVRPEQLRPPVDAVDGTASSNGDAADAEPAESRPPARGKAKRRPSLGSGKPPTRRTH